MKRILLPIFFLLPFAPPIVSQEYVIKFATLAPEGSTWMNVMKEYDAAVRKESGGRLRFKMYPGGVAGDEKDVLRKIRLGQYHSAGFTGVGLGEIAPVVRILDSPFLFKRYDEVDNIYEKFDQEFSKAFLDAGYVLIGWAEVGFVYMLTNKRIYAPEDLKGVKMWMWEGDPIAEASFKALGVSPISLSITDVLTSLQTGLIDGVYTSPLAAIALQWFTRVKYMVEIPLADAAGAVIISKKEFNRLPTDLQEILLRNGKIHMKKLAELSREDNRKSLETLKKSGIQFTKPASAKVLEQYDEIGKKARRMLVGKLFTQDFLERVEQAVLEYRHAHSK